MRSFGLGTAVLIAFSATAIACHSYRATTRSPQPADDLRLELREPTELRAVRGHDTRTLHVVSLRGRVERVDHDTVVIVMSDYLAPFGEPALPPPQVQAAVAAIPLNSVLRVSTLQTLCVVVELEAQSVLWVHLPPESMFDAESELARRIALARSERENAP